MTNYLDWSADKAEEHLRTAVRAGWMRMRPQSLSLILMGAGLHDHAPTREKLAIYASRPSNPDGSLAASCWEGPEDLDEEDLAAASDPHLREDATRYAAHYGLQLPETVDDLITLMVTAGLLREAADEDGTIRLRPQHPLPNPGDVFPLTEDEAETQRQLRMDMAYEEDSFRIINLFDPEGERREEITTSLERLARTVEGSPHDACQAVLLLLRGGDFTASIDVANAAPHKVFRLRCDWDEFDRSRIGIHGFDDDGRIVVTLPADDEEGDPR